jgi:plasmid stability protein
MGALSKRTRITIELPVEVIQRLRIIAARQDVSVRQYILEILEERLAQDWAELVEQEGFLALNASVDPVLAEIWDNEKDAAYNQL